MLGSLLAVGRTSEVFAYGNDAVAKVLTASVPDHWAAVEAHLTEAVRALGVPAPAVRELVTVDGRPAVVFERVVGPSMWQQMQADPSSISGLTADLAAVQNAIHAAGVPDAVPALVERMAAKIVDVGSLGAADRDEAIQMAHDLPRGGALLHGDLHPGNILLGPDGPVVIDWFDASVGHPAADVARTSLLLRAEDVTDLRHLPDATPEILARVHADYLDEMRDVVDADALNWRRWKAVTAVSRLAEQSDADPAGLHAIWAARASATLV